MARQSSTLYGTNLFRLTEELCKTKDGVINVNMQDDAIRGLTVIKDGEITPEKYEQLMKQADELRITSHEVDILIEQVKKEKLEAERGILPLQMIKERPEIAFEQIRMAISSLRQIAATGNRQQIQQLFDTPGKATDDERAIWRQIDRG
jgi:hypothetical protein